MAEYIVAQRGLARAAMDAKALEQFDRDRNIYQKEFRTLVHSLSDRIDTLGIRSPTRLSSNIFWDEYFKTDRQLRAERLKKQKQGGLDESKIVGFKMAPGATKVTGFDSDSDDDYGSDSDASASSDGSEFRKKRKNKKVPPQSAPPNSGRQSMPLGAKPSTAGGASTRPNYSLDDAEFDDDNRRRLRMNAMSAIERETSAKSHPFIKKMILAKMEPPKTVEDANTVALAKKRAQAKRASQQDDDIQPRARSGSQTQQQQQLQQQQQQQQRASTAKPRKSRASLALEEMAKQTQRANLINPIFLEERSGQELYRILVQQEIKWTRQAVSEASRRNRLSSKREFAFFS